MNADDLVTSDLAAELERRALNGTLLRLPGRDLIRMELSEAASKKVAVYCLGGCSEGSDCVSRQRCFVVSIRPDGTLDTANGWYVTTDKGCPQRGFFSRSFCRLRNVFARVP
jgi:hypothetical protein